MDHLKLLRRQKKLRREEEERRAARSDTAVPSTSTNNEARPEPDPVARLAPNNSSNNEVRKPAYKAAAPQQLESQKKLVAKQAPVSTFSSSQSPPSPVTRKRPRALEPDPAAQVREPQVTKKELFTRPTFRKAAPPKEVLDKNSYASPASSVSFSQSPSKETTAVRKQPAALKLAPPPAPPAQKKRAPTMYRNFGARDDSSSEEEDEDLFAFARALEAKKRAPAGTEPPAVQVAAAAADTEGVVRERATAAKPSSVPLQNGTYNARNEDKEDIVQASRRLEAHRNQHQQVDTARIDNDDNDNDEGKADKPTTPRNPIARAKENTKPFFQVSPPATMGVDDLFDDEEEEEEEAAVEEVAPGEKKKRPDTERPKKKRNNNASNKTRERTTTNNNLFPTAEDALDKDTAALQAELKPDFERPKFGPFVFDPLKLVTTNSVAERPVGVMGPDAGDVGDDEDTQEEFEVPASINRFLPNYQQEGIRFLYELVSSRRGGILGDDMGVGKTVQIISLLSALFHKTGTGLDLQRIQLRQKAAAARAARETREKQTALLAGRVWKDTVAGDFEPDLAQWAPVLIIVPPSIIQNWTHDFDMWGHFSIAVYQGTGRTKALESIQRGVAEVLICPKSLFMMVSDFRKLSAVPFKLIIVDEFHQFKNRKGLMAEHLRGIRDEQSALVVGLTGTVMQNSHDELWNLVDIVAKDHLGCYEEFKHGISQAIMLARTKDANSFAVELGDLKSKELTDKLRSLYLRRTKDEVLKDALPMKDERIVFCEPSELQKLIYQHILEQPDFVLLSQANGPCECGVNQKFFLEYQHLTTKEQRVEYQRRNKDKIVKRAKCCHSIPVLPGEGIDPRAVLWRQHQHHDGLNECENCPFCILFSALHILYKLSSHVGLLQVPEDPSTCKVGSKAHTKALNNVERAKVFLPLDILSQLPGGSYMRQDSIMDDHFSLSGKMKVVDKLLRAIYDQQGRVLLFSGSTQSLDLIQNFVKSEGYSHLRMDGTTSTRKRDELKAEFANSNTFLFLLSTKAMGLGLNLTQANFVIIFDVEWNPSYDAQAQDRAYRIGQEKDVKVFRLVSTGTIEELKYLRQVYKTQLKTETIIESKDEDREKSARLFRGVAGDKERKGELFGLANLLKFKDGTFMDYASNKADSRRYGVGVTQTENLLQSVDGMTGEEFAAIGDDDHMFEDLARRTSGAKGKSEDDDDDDDSILGGESQVQLHIYENADAFVDEEEVKVDEDVETADLSAQRPPPTREKMAAAAEERGFEASKMPAKGNMARPKSENVVVDLTTPAEKPAPAAHLEDVKLSGVAGARDNIQPRVVGSSEAQQPPAAVAVADESIVSNFPPEAIPGVTRGNIQPRAAGSSEAQQPTAAAPVLRKQDEGIVSDVSKETQLLSVAAEGARKEPEAQQSDVAVAGIISNSPKEAQLLSVAAERARKEPAAQQPTAAVPGREKSEAQQPDAAVAGIVSNAQEAKLPSVAAKGVRKESTKPRNATLCGKTTNDIQSGKTKTTFSALDLPLPSGAKRKKKRKAST